MTGPYRVEPLKAGCPHCGHGEEWKIVGPALSIEDAEDYIGWSKSSVQDEANRLNQIFEAGVASAQASEIPTDSISENRESRLPAGEQEANRPVTVSEQRSTTEESK